MEAERYDTEYGVYFQEQDDYKLALFEAWCQDPEMLRSHVYISLEAAGEFSFTQQFLDMDVVCYLIDYEE